MPLSAPNERELVRQFPNKVQTQIEESLRRLLQEKHLYQSLSVEVGRVPLAGDDRSEIKATVQWAMDQIYGPWTPIDPQNRRMAFVAADQADKYFYFTPPDVKLFCTACDRVEPFNLVSAEDIFQRDARVDGYREGRDTIQVFVFSFQCQACKGAPEVLMVRRKGFKLTNCGRAPIEHVQVPNDVPKQVRSFFSGAIVAHQSGQTLAALFLLRTLIEQFARFASDSKAENADQVMEAYMGTLPDDFKKRFASMRELYGELSVDLHSATGSPDLFEKARTQIVEHFETRRVFKLLFQERNQPL